MTFTNGLSPTAIALNRFGLGANPNDAPPSDPKAWLKAQFADFTAMPQGFAALPDAGAMMKAYQGDRREAKQQAMASPPPPPQPGAPPPRYTPEQRAIIQDFGEDVRSLYRQAVQARAQSALETRAPFVERLVHFWSNHFCVSADNPRIMTFVGAFERDAIRPHVLGNFEDMLLAADRHPAMLIYLNQVLSVGPNSAQANRAKMRDPQKHIGLNENLAREIMELHTLGVRSGYSQADVTEFARAMTGWTVGGTGTGSRIDDGNPGDFQFRPQLHEPGTRVILGKSYAQGGEAQARAAIVDFAHAPQTATHIATKLARHFAGDNPPQPMIDRLAAAFTSGQGDLPTLYKALIDSPEAWNPQPLKFKTPWEWTVSALRGLGRDQVGQNQIASIQNQLGQPVWKPGSPAGWDDTAASWAAPDALLRRVEFVERLVAPVGDQIDARQLGPKLIPASFSPATADQIGRAESPGSALALLLVSPDFLRR
jgi:uncharacterized protein (DUF1800 family)